MLNIYFGEWNYDDENYIWDMNAYFDSNFENHWINDDITRKIIKEIDKSEVIVDKAIDSPFLGVIPPERLSGGAKLLITINIEKGKHVYNGTKCGQNCSDWLLELSKNEEITISRCYPITFTKEPFSVRVLNDNSIVTNNMELHYKLVEFI